MTLHEQAQFRLSGNHSMDFMKVLLQSREVGFVSLQFIYEETKTQRD